MEKNAGRKDWSVISRLTLNDVAPDDHAYFAVVQTMLLQQSRRQGRGCWSLNVLAFPCFG